MLNVDIAYQIPSWIQRLMPDYQWRGDVSRKVAYLTFDDGPIPDITLDVRDILNSYQVPATFFMVGDNVQRYPEIYQQIVDAGHAIGNHTFHHTNGWSVDTASYIADVEKADTLLSSTRLFRPPYGKLTCTQRKALIAKGYTICLWDVLTHDYDASYSSDQLLRIVQRYVRHGSIINFHDSVKSNERMLQALPQVIEWLIAAGYTFEKITAPLR